MPGGSSGATTAGSTAQCRKVTSRQYWVNSVRPAVLGAVGVSGVTSAQDAQVARAGAAAVRP